MVRPPSTRFGCPRGFFYKFVLSDANDVQSSRLYDNLYGIINVSAPCCDPHPLVAASCCGLVRLVQSLRAMYCATVTNGTPDLRDRFVVGAGSTYAVDATGGSADSQSWSRTTTRATSTSVVTDPGHIHDSAIATDGVFGSSMKATAGGGTSTATTSSAQL
jgi:hypothetical protein